MVAAQTYAGWFFFYLCSATSWRRLKVVRGCGLGMFSRASGWRSLLGRALLPRTQLAESGCGVGFRGRRGAWLGEL